jgi:cytochrome c-type biogenesis protein CcmH/NrfF
MAIPPRKGYNLLAWIVPFAILVIGGLILRSVVVGWRRDHRSSAHDKVDPPVQAEAGTDAYKDQLRRDLNNFDPS